MTDLRIALTASLNDKLAAPLRQTLGVVESLLEKSSQKLAGLDSKAGALGRNTGPARLKTELQGIGQAADRAHASTKRLVDLLPTLARGVGSAFAGFQAAKMVLAAPLQRAADYELNLARASNIAYAERNTVAGRQAGMREMDSAVRGATLQGVSRDNALVGLKTLIGGGMERTSAMAILPTMAKFSMAGDADMKDVANLALKTQQLYKIPTQKMPQALQMALTSGKDGQFEFKDMASWLPEQMAISSNILGMSGTKDLSTLLAANQFAARAAGSNNSAGNNFVNFLGKINSPDTANDAKKLGIDLTGTLAKARSEGTDPVDAFVALVTRTANADPEYRKLQAKRTKALESGDKNGQAETLTAMSSLLQGRAIGKWVNDRQALMGLTSIMSDPKGFKEMRERLRTSEGGVDVDQATLMATTAVKNEQAENAMLNRQYDALKGFGGAIGDAQMKIAELSTKYPEAASGLEALKLAAYTAAAGLAAVGAVNLLTRAPKTIAAPTKTVPAGAATYRTGTSLLNGPAGGGAQGIASAGSALSRVASLAGAGLAAANPLMLIEALSSPSEADIAKLYEMDRAKSGYRGKGFVDPRMLGVGEGVEAVSGTPNGSVGGSSTSVAMLEKLMAGIDKTMAEVKALSMRPVLVQIDGREIASSINEHSTFQARRQ